MKQTIIKTANHRVSRFAGVGVFNTLLDFALFNGFIITFGGLGSSWRIITYNTISASSVALVSFFLNRRYVFKSQHTPPHYALYFIAITLCGLYLVQNAIIYAVLHWFNGLADIALSILGVLGITNFSREFVLANGAKAAATAGSMVWNYIMYKKVIFRPVTAPAPDTTD